MSRKFLQHVKYSKLNTTSYLHPLAAVLPAIHFNSGVTNSRIEVTLAGMDNNLLVSKYHLELPKREEMERFLAAQLKELGDGE